MAKIKKIIAREILDSRGYPTVEAIVVLEDESVGVFSVPSGISVGKHEAVEIRDGDITRYAGRGVLKALKNIYSTLAPLILGKDALEQRFLDSEMINADGTKNKSKLGANSILALSGAIVKAQAASSKMPIYQYVNQMIGGRGKDYVFPTPMFNILNGGKHGDNNLDIQEFMIVSPRANKYSDNLKIGVEIYYALKETIINHSAITLVGDEGGYAPTLYSNLDAFKLLEAAVVRAGYELGNDVFFCIDAAASHFKHGFSYKLKDRPISLSANDLIDFYISLMEQYHLLLIEDPLGEDDWDDWQTLSEKIGVKTLIVGDDLITTNIERLQKAINLKACNAVIVKPNQVGTISETIDVIKASKAAGFKVVVSHRSGETNDDFIVDFSLGVGADYVKFGAPARGERVAKYNRMLEIEHELS